MVKFIDRAGETFGDLLVLRCTQKSNGKLKTKYECLCSCGDISEYQASNLVTGNSTCCVRCRTSKRVVHGHARRNNQSSTYQSWQHMIQRCTNPNDDNYHNYGGRGITVCNEWLNDFDRFITDLGERPANTTLERIDVNGVYEKSNCRWASSSMQCYNKRKSLKNKSNKEGVFLRKDTGKWTAYINKDGVRHRLGCFLTYEEAVAAREMKELELYGIIKP